MSNYIFTEIKIKDVYIIDAKIYGDRRECFMETYKEEKYEM